MYQRLTSSQAIVGAVAVAVVVLGLTVWLLPMSWQDEAQARRVIAAVLFGLAANGAALLVTLNFLNDPESLGHDWIGRRLRMRTHDQWPEHERDWASEQALPLGGVDLRDAELRGVDLTRSNLAEARLDGADLYGARLVQADLRRTVLRGADLRGADLTGANLIGANLIGARLKGARLTDATYDHGTRWPDQAWPAVLKQARRVSR